MKYSDYGNWKAEGLEDTVTAGQHLMDALSCVAKTGGSLFPSNDEIVRLLTTAVSHVSAAMIKYGQGDEEVIWNESSIYDDTSKLGHIDSIINDFASGMFGRAQAIENDNWDDNDTRWVKDETEELLADLKQYARIFFNIQLDECCEQLKAKNAITREIRVLKEYAEEAVIAYCQPYKRDAVTGRNNHADALEVLNEKAAKLQEKWHGEFPDFLDQPIPSPVSVKERDSYWDFHLRIKTILGDQNVTVSIHKDASIR